MPGGCVAGRIRGERRVVSEAKAAEQATPKSLQRFTRCSLTDQKVIAPSSGEGNPRRRLTHPSLGASVSGRCLGRGGCDGLAGSEALGHLPVMPAFRRIFSIQRTAGLVLTVLCLRALIPAGFMLAAVDGRLQVVLCDASASMAMHEGAMSGMQGMSGPPGDGSGQHEHSRPDHSHADPNCPFALSAGPAPLPFLSVLPPRPVAPRFSAASINAHISSPCGPARAQAARAPPGLT
jgi:hypothetical protein